MGAPHEKMAFQAEVKQLLHLMIHSLYSNKEIFLRELVSNASDAVDKLRFEGIADPSLLEGGGELGIRIGFDAQARTVTIADNGIGMSRDEAIRNLGTIARSGTREFFSQLSGDQQKDAALIGQFGVGFYSAFIVADRVTVESRRAGVPAAEGVRWEKRGRRRVHRRCHRARRARHHHHAAPARGRGRFPLRLAPEVHRAEVLGPHLLPIAMRKESWDEEKKEMVAQDEWETINQASALWARPRADVTDEQYIAFYQHIAHEQGQPLAWTHNRVEGRSEYTQLLYLPTNAPFDLWDRERRSGLKLYVKRVFIMDDAEQLLPAYLRFVKGVIDSADLPLNVSREILQESRDVKAIREGSTKRVLGMLESMADSDDAAEKDKYATFWQHFGQVLKEGLGEDFANKDRIAKLLRFASTHNAGDEQTVSLADYIGRMKDGQDKIYYVSAENWTAAKSGPHLEVFRKKGVEVLLLTDRVDEWMLSFLHDFEEKALVSVARGGLDLGSLEDEAERAEHAKVEGEFKPLVDRAKAVLADKAKDVRITHRLTDSPSCLVADEGDISGTLARLLKQAGQKAPDTKPVLELNPAHPLVRKLALLESVTGGEADRAAFEDRLHVLFDQALLAEGGSLADPADYVQRVNRLLA